MKTSDLEFEYNERKDGYIYINEDRLESEIKKILIKGSNIESMEIPQEISRDAYLCLTKKRENILNWYSLDQDSDVLELGAGYGELTEYLCMHTKNVTCYERKTERIDIINLRCKKYGNLTCCGGDLQEQNWNETFDYVIIHDIFTLARKFYKGENPNVDLLKFVRKHLKPQGKILIFTENRLGLKYFSGATEEISNQFFWGLNSYDEDERSRTFSKSELEDIIRKSGMLYLNWFYPYPNLVYPLEIYTDEIRDKIVYGISKPDYEIISDRYEFFNEQRMFWTLHQEKIENQFANAFFVECSMQPIKKQILFADMENEFVIANKKNGKFIDINGNLLPDGIRLDAYLVAKIQDTVNCNLGNKNPYIFQIYDVFRGIYQFLLKENYQVSDLYYQEGELRGNCRESREKRPASEYERWKLTYDWYVFHIMFYRNASRRIKLEHLVEIMHIQTENISGYLQQWKLEQDRHYIIPRLGQSMFDFEAEDAKDLIYFERENMDQMSIKSQLIKMWR